MLGRGISGLDGFRVLGFRVPPNRLNSNRLILIVIVVAITVLVLMKTATVRTEKGEVFKEDWFVE